MGFARLIQVERGPLKAHIYPFFVVVLAAMVFGFAGLGSVAETLRVVLSGLRRAQTDTQYTHI